MKSLLFVVMVMMLSSALASPDVENHALLLRSRRNIDLMENTRKLIVQLADNLRHSAQETLATVSNFSTAVTQDVNSIREKLVGNLQQFRSRVQLAIENVVNRLSNTGSAVRECLDSQRAKAAAVFNQTSSLTLSCIDKQVADIGEQIEHLRTLAQGAMDGGAKAIEDMRKCTEGSPNILSAGSCLGVLAVQTELKSAGFIAQSVVMIGRINLSIAALPASLEVCAGSQIVHAGMETGKIVIDVGSCSANAIFNSVTGNQVTPQSINV